MEGEKKITFRVFVIRGFVSESKYLTELTERNRVGGG